MSRRCPWRGTWNRNRKPATKNHGPKEFQSGKNPVRLNDVVPTRIDEAAMNSTMRTIRPAWLAAVGIVTAAIGWVATELTSRASLALPVLPLSSLITMALIVVVCLVLGFKVRRWRDGKRDKVLDPLLAARTVVLAQACAYAGAVLFGWHTGILLDQLPTIAMRADLAVIWQMVALMAGAVVMVVVGVVVERFCKLPPEDNEPTTKPRPKHDGRGEEEFA